MQKKRLLKLAAFLRTVPKEKFNIDSWADFGEGAEGYGKKINSCGTTACALGWATVCFPRSKLKLHKKLVNGDWRGFVSYNGEMRSCPYLGERRDIYQTSAHAARKFFGLNTDQVKYIFVDPPSNFTGSQVADRIEAFVKNNGKL